MQTSIPGRFRAHAVLLFLLLQSSIVHAQVENAKGRIEGTVLRAGSTEPVVGARVTLTWPGSGGNTGGNFVNMAGGAFPLPSIPPPATPSLNPSGAAFVMPPPVVTTDRAGKFVISFIDPGSYRLVVTGNGYVRQEYGQKVPGGSGAPLVLTAGQVLKDLTIAIMQTGNVSGRIVDNYGQPGVGVPLQLLRVSYNQNGQRVFQTVGSARTNDRGEYRIFWVTPGRYYLTGGTPQGTPAIAAVLEKSGPNEPGDSYAFTFYPGVTDSTRATAIDLRPGNDLTLDFVVLRQELYAMRGRVVDPSSNVPPASVGISLSFQSIASQNIRASLGAFYDATTGTFELRNVLPGSYLLYINSLGGIARVPVEVVNANVEGIVATVSKPLQIPGRFSIEGGGTMPFASASRVQFRPIVGGASTLAGVVPSSGTISSDGSFEVANVMPGEYLILSVPPEGHYVKQARLGRYDTMSRSVELAQGLEGLFMDVILSPNVSQIDGTVTDERQLPVSNVQAVLIPDLNREHIELFKAVTTDADGHFVLQGVAPGNYKVFAWEGLENYGYFDPELLRRSEALGKSIQVPESSKVFADVRIIPTPK